MCRLCLPLINTVNKNLTFTAEVASDFESGRLPTLDFELWQESKWTICHNYFQKPMKTPFCVMKRSALSQHQKISILANEAVRRLSNTDHLRGDPSEKIKMLEIFTEELIISEYGRSEIINIIASGIKGWKEKIKRRKAESRPFYRHAASTLSQRCTRKLVEKTTWYRRGRKIEDDKGDTRREAWSESRNTIEEEREEDPGKENNSKENALQMPKQPNIKAVLFVPYTNSSELAKMLRETGKSNIV